MKITPYDHPGRCCTGRLLPTITYRQIVKVLGFRPNCDDDESKVKYSWGFIAEYNGKRVKCGIWDYKGSRWSTYGPQEVFDYLFKDIK